MKVLVDTNVLLDAGAARYSLVPALSPSAFLACSRATMTSQFTFLATEWPGVFEAARQAESVALHLIRGTASLHARRAVEMIVRWLYKHDATLRLPYQDNLERSDARADLQGGCRPESSACQGEGGQGPGKSSRVHSHKKILETDAFSRGEGASSMSAIGSRIPTPKRRNRRRLAPASMPVLCPKPTGPAKQTIEQLLQSA